MDNYDIKVSVIKFDVNWTEIKNLCRTTIGQLDSDKAPGQNWKRTLLLAEHSPLRHGNITIEIDNIPFAIMGHLVRHGVGVTPYVQTSRADRTEIKDRSQRSQMDPVRMRMDLNLQSLINVSRKRLCGQADPTTRKVWYMVVKEIAKYDADVAWACVPECIRDCDCPEFYPCGFYDNLMKNEPVETQRVLKRRYDKYNEWRDRA